MLSKYGNLYMTQQTESMRNILKYMHKLLPAKNGINKIDSVGCSERFNNFLVTYQFLLWYFCDRKRKSYQSEWKHKWLKCIWEKMPQKIALSKRIFWNFVERWQSTRNENWKRSWFWAFFLRKFIGEFWYLGNSPQR